MLVLSRYKDESIMIGENIEVKVIDIRGGKVRLGITAPRSISVHRREVYEAIHRKKVRNMEANNFTFDEYEKMYSNCHDLAKALKVSLIKFSCNIMKNIIYEFKQVKSCRRLGRHGSKKITCIT